MFESDQTPLSCEDANDLVFLPVTIALGESLSEAIDIGAGQVIVGMIFPSGWVTAIAAFQAAVSIDGTYGTVKHADGSALSLASCIASDYRVVGDELVNFRGLRYVKVQSGT